MRRNIKLHVYGICCGKKYQTFSKKHRLILAVLASPQIDISDVRLKACDNIIAYAFDWESSTVRDANSVVTLAVIDHQSILLVHVSI